MTRATELWASPLALPSALADAAALALRQSMSLNATLLQEVVGLALAHAHRATVDPFGALRDAMLSPALAEPMWRWASGWAALGPQAAMSVAGAVSPPPTEVATAFGWPSAAAVDDALQEAGEALGVTAGPMRAVAEAAIAPVQAMLRAIDDADGARIGAADADDRSARPTHAFAEHAVATADDRAARRPRGGARATARNGEAKAASRRGKPAAGGRRRGAPTGR
ncbi:MAG: hypothetical protein RJA99_2923 [Pseudomonadota bacterium]|jgi:hypothetical protein